jgi:hypothetical protein
VPAPKTNLAATARDLANSKPLAFPCPGCGKRVDTTIGEVRGDPLLRCENDHALEVDGSDIDRIVRSGLEIFEELDRAEADLRQRLERGVERALTAREAHDFKRDLRKLKRKRRAAQRKFAKGTTKELKIRLARTEDR